MQISKQFFKSQIKKFKGLNCKNILQNNTFLGFNELDFVYLFDSEDANIQKPFIGNVDLQISGSATQGVNPLTFNTGESDTVFSSGRMEGELNVDINNKTLSFCMSPILKRDRDNYIFLNTNHFLFSRALAARLQFSYKEIGLARKTVDIVINNKDVFPNSEIVFFICYDTQNSEIRIYNSVVGTNSIFLVETISILNDLEDIDTIFIPQNVAGLGQFNYFALFSKILDTNEMKLALNKLNNSSYDSDSINYLYSDKFLEVAIPIGNLYPMENGYLISKSGNLNLSVVQNVLRILGNSSNDFSWLTFGDLNSNIINIIPQDGVSIGCNFSWLTSGKISFGYSDSPITSQNFRVNYEVNDSLDSIFIDNNQFVTFGFLRTSKSFMFSTVYNYTFLIRNEIAYVAEEINNQQTFKFYIKPNTVTDLDINSLSYTDNGISINNTDFVNYVYDGIIPDKTEFESTFFNNYIVVFKVNSLPTTSQNVLSFRYKDENNYYFVQVTELGEVSIEKVVNGVQNTISILSHTVNILAGDIIQLHVDNARFELIVKGNSQANNGFDTFDFRNKKKFIVNVNNDVVLSNLLCVTKNIRGTDAGVFYNSAVNGVN